MTTEGVEGSVVIRPRMAQGTNPFGNALDRTEVDMAGPAMSNCLVADAIFLLAKRETDEGGRHEIRIGATHGVERTGANPQANVAKAKQGATRRVGRLAQVFARAKKEEETDHETLSRRACREGGFEVSQCPDLGDHRQR
jgi:hypothetical protein